MWIEPLRGGPRSSNGGRLALTPASIKWEGMEMSLERDERVRELLQQALTLLDGQQHVEVRESEAAPEVAAPAPTETPTEAEAEAMEPVPGPETPEAPQAEVTA